MPDLKKMSYTIIAQDAEMTAMGAIPPLLKDLPKERKIEVLKYILKRYESGDEFGLT